MQFFAIPLADDSFGSCLGYGCIPQFFHANILADDSLGSCLDYGCIPQFFFLADDSLGSGYGCINQIIFFWFPSYQLLGGQNYNLFLACHIENLVNNFYHK